MRFLGSGIGHQQSGESTFTETGADSLQDEMEVDDQVAEGPGADAGVTSSDEEDPANGYYPSADEGDGDSEGEGEGEDEGEDEGEGSDDDTPDLGPEDGEGDMDIDNNLEYVGFTPL